LAFATLSCAALNVHAWSLVNCWNKCSQKLSHGNKYVAISSESFCDGATDAIECSFACVPKELKESKGIKNAILHGWNEMEEDLCHDENAPCKSTKEEGLCHHLADEDYHGNDAKTGKHKSLIADWNQCMDTHLKDGYRSADAFCDGMEDAIGCQFEATPDEIANGAAKMILKRFEQIGTKVCDGNGSPCKDHSFCDVLATGGRKFIHHESRLFEDVTLDETALLHSPLEQHYESWKNGLHPSRQPWFYAICGAVAAFTVGAIGFRMREWRVTSDHKESETSESQLLEIE